MALSPDVRHSLTERFNAKLPLKAAALIHALAALDSGGSEARAAAQQIAHQLAGTAATFGWTRISSTASEVDRCEDAQLPAILERLIALVREAVVLAEVSSRILIVEDQGPYVDHLQAGLAAPERSFDVAATGAEAIERLAERRYDLVLLDILLPDTDGRSLLTTLKDDPATASTPVIVLSQVSESTIESECLAHGAEAFFDKAVPLERLSTAIAGALAHHHEHCATSRHDPVTGLLNRAGLREAFGRMQARRSGQASPPPAAFALIDIDHFAELVRTGSPGAGEQALALLVGCFEADLADEDITGRWGHDEFVVVLSAQDLPRALATLERVQDRLHSLSVADGEALTISGGLVDVEPSLSFETAMSRANQLLYVAKRTGRDRIAGPGVELMTPRPRVLLAEDDDETAQQVITLLTQSGLDVDREDNGRSALDAARRHSYATIIVDRTMPGMDGYELIERLRDDRRNRMVPIIMLTTASTEVDISLAFELGADDYVHKPFKPAELVARVQRLTRRVSNRYTTAELDPHGNRG